jgi:hypothetical protein
VKLYPPMGFRADLNATRGETDHPMQMDVLDDVFGKSNRTQGQIDSQTTELGLALDEALHELYDYCGRHGVPIMAHASNSFSSNCELGELADPYYWKPVFEPKTGTPPPVMLAHYGAFKFRSADPSLNGNIGYDQKSCPTDPLAKDVKHSWEGWLADYMSKNQSRQVYADCSYFSEVFADAQGQAKTLSNFGTFDTATLTALRDRLVFGTDWLLLAQESYVPSYSSQVRAFLAQIFSLGPTDPALDGIMRGNFLKYAGLSPGSDNFNRIATVYGNDKVLRDRLTAACTI